MHFIIPIKYGIYIYCLLFIYISINPQLFSLCMIILCYFIHIYNYLFSYIYFLYFCLNYLSSLQLQTVFPLFITFRTILYLYNFLGTRVFLYSYIIHSSTSFILLSASNLLLFVLFLAKRSPPLSINLICVLFIKNTCPRCSSRQCPIYLSYVFTILFSYINPLSFIIILLILYFISCK